LAARRTQKLGCPVRVISLKHSYERRTFLQNQFKKLGIEFTFFDAVDGKTLSEADLENYSEKAALKMEGRILSPNEIGCALSHLKLYQELLESGHECYLIFEDDIIIGEMLLGVVKARERLPKDWEFINFFTSKEVQPFGDFIFDIYRAGRFKKSANMAAAYLINRSGARKLLEAAYPIRLAADGLTGRTHVTGLISYGISPRVAAIREVNSDIGHRGHPNFFYRMVKRVKLIYKYIKTGEVGL
jgi:glycosyl transferase, family 25